MRPSSSKCRLLAGPSTPLRVAFARPRPTSRSISVNPPDLFHVGAPHLAIDGAWQKAGGPHSSIGLHKGGYNRGQNCPQVDLSFAPLRDPVAPHPTSGRVISPHGLIGQSFDGDGIAVDGKMDHCAIAARATPHTPFSPRAHSARPPQTARCGGGSRLSNRMKSRQRRRQKAP